MSEHSYGEGTIYQRVGSPYWWASFYVNGTGFKKSTGCRIAEDPEQKAAARWLRKKQIATEAGTYVPQADRLSFEDLAGALRDNWALNARRATKSMRASVAHLRETFGNHRATQITMTAIEKYKAARLAAGAARGTINHELAMLRRMFNLAKKAGTIPTPPHIEMLKLSNTRQGFVDPADFDRLLAVLPEHLRGWIEFLYLTSWRAGEGRTLGWADVDLQGRAIRLKAEHSKNGCARLVKLSGRLLEVVERAMADRRPDCRFLFHHDGKPLIDCTRSWRTACAKAGLGDLLVHDLRRSGIRNMVRAGVPESIAMRISGHKTRITFERYNITSESDLDAAAERIDAFLETKRQEPSKVAVLANRRAA